MSIIFSVNASHFIESKISSNEDIASQDFSKNYQRL